MSPHPHPIGDPGPESSNPVPPLRLLFLCARNQWRSPTAEAIYQNDPRVQVASAGVSSSARRRVTEKLLRWAALVLVMEHSHKRRLQDTFPDLAPDLTIGVLDIPDDYVAMDAELITLIRQRVEPWLSRDRDGMGTFSPNGEADPHPFL